MSNRKGVRYRRTRTGLLVADKPRILRAGSPGGGHLVRNQETGRVLPCCYDTCENQGDNRIQIAVPHDAPRWPGEKLVYIFCSDTCRREFAKGTPYEQYV